MFVGLGYRANVAVAFGLLSLVVAVQLAMTPLMQPRTEPPRVPLRNLLRSMLEDIRQLLFAEVLIRWGEWFVRSFAALYVFDLLAHRLNWRAESAASMVGILVAVGNITALTTYLPVARWADRSSSPKPFIALTSLLFALFPIMLVALQKLALWAGLPVPAGLVATFVINGLREIGKPARKALIAGAFPTETKARAVSLYWGLRSFAFRPAPLVAAGLYHVLGPESMLLMGGGIGLAGTTYYVWSNRGLGPGLHYP